MNNRLESRRLQCVVIVLILYCHYIVVHLHDKQLYIQWS